jgi:hypothetical protein
MVATTVQHTKVPNISVNKVMLHLVTKVNIISLQVSLFESILLSPITLIARKIIAECSLPRLQVYNSDCTNTNASKIRDSRYIQQRCITDAIYSSPIDNTKPNIIFILSPDPN